MDNYYKIKPCPSKGASNVGSVFFPSYCDVDRCVCSNLTCNHCEHCNCFAMVFNRVYAAINGYMLLKYGF